MLSFRIGVSGLLGLGRVLRCYVRHLGEIKNNFPKNKNALKVAHVVCWEGLIMSSEIQNAMRRLGSREGVGVLNF